MTKLTAPQQAAMKRLSEKGVLHAYNGVSRTTIKRLETLGLVTVTWSVNTWTNYRSHRSHSQCDWTARPTTDPPPLWNRLEPGHYVRYASDGVTVQARIVREPELRAGGLLGPDRWTAWILPSHGGWNASRPGLRTIKDAQAWIEQSLPEAEAEIAAKRAAGQLIEQIVCGDGGDEMGCADCAVAPNDSWPYGSDVCGECWDRALAELKDT